MEFQDDIEAMYQQRRTALINDPNIPYELAEMRLKGGERIKAVLDLNSTSKDSIYIPEMLDVVSATIDKVLRTAKETTYHLIPAGTTDADPWIFNELLKMHPRYPLAPKHFFFVPHPELNIPGVMHYGAGLHDQDTRECFGTCTVVLRRYSNDMVEITVELSRDSLMDDLTSAYTALHAVKEERHTLNVAYADKSLAQKEIRARSRRASLQEATARRQINLAEARTYGTRDLVRAALLDGLLGLFISNEINRITADEREAHTRIKLRAAKEPKNSTMPIPSDPIDRMIVELYYQAPTIGQREIAEKIGLVREQINRRVKRLRKEGYTIGTPKPRSMSLNVTTKSQTKHSSRDKL